MILTCPSCTASYEIPIDLPEEGRKVRCAKCEHIWVAQPSDEEEAPPAAEEEAPQAEAEEEALPDSGPEPQSVEALPPDVSVEDDIGFREADEETSETSDIDEASIEALLGESSQEEEPAVEEAPPEEEPAPVEQEAAADDEPQDQGSIDAMFDSPGDDEPQDQDGIDAMFDGAGDDEPQDQDSIDSMFDAPDEPEPEPEAPNGQGNIDDIMGSGEDTDDSAAAVDFDPPEPEKVEPEPVFVAPEPAPIPSMVPPQPIITPAQQNKQQAMLLAAGWGALAASVIALAAVAYFNGEAVVSTIPGAANIYESAGTHINIRGLEFRGVSYTWEADRGQPVLHVKGSIINLTDETLRVPTVVFALRDGQGVELFHWAKNLQQKPLYAGQSAGFAARIPSPPVAVRSLQVRFAKAK